MNYGYTQQWVNLKNNFMYSEGSQTKEEYRWYDFIYIKFQKMQIVCSDRKQISGCLGVWEGWEEGVMKGTRKLGGWGGGQIHYSDCEDGFPGVDTGHT